MAGVSSLARSLLDLVFPPRCVSCQALGVLLCDRCRVTITPPRPPLCARCGRPLQASRAGEQCDLCASGRGSIHLTRLRVATDYDGAIRAAILAYKFRSVGAGNVEPLGEMLADAYVREGLNADLVTHVPLHTKRRRERGYDQSHLLARELAQRLNLPLLPDAIKRVRATEAQTHLQGDQRIANVAGAFTLTNPSVIERVKDRRILLIDDVTSTGSTLDATAAALAEARPAAIFGLALSRPNTSAFS